MLNCGAIRRSRDKKPGGNRLDMASAGRKLITEITGIGSRLSEDLIISVCEAASETIDTLNQESLNMTSVFTGLAKETSDTLSLDEASFAESIVGEPQIAAFRGNAD